MTPANKPARDGNIAIREEFDAAMRKNTVEAWQLFIARHPDHALTPQAVARLNALRNRSGSNQKPARDGDIAIREEYEAARVEDSVAALELFVARHPDHPLSGQARERIAYLKAQSVAAEKDPVPPRDGDIAIQQEYEAARVKDTVEALELFVARHPDHPLAMQAQERLATLRPGRVVKERHVPRDGDIAIQEEFEAARAKNTETALETFIARHPGHPLALQATAHLETLRTQ